MAGFPIPLYMSWLVAPVIVDSASTQVSGLDSSGDCPGTVFLGFGWNARLADEVPLRCVDALNSGAAALPTWYRVRACPLA